jgi:hypothetical protein
MSGCSLSGEWPNILHSPTPPCNSFSVSIFTWCHFYYNSGGNIPLDVTSPCISIYRDAIFTTNVPCRPLIWVTRLLGLYATLGGCKDIHMDVTWPLVITSQLTLFGRVMTFNYKLSQYQLGLTIVPPTPPLKTSKRLHHVTCPMPWFLFVICYLAYGMWILLIGCQHISSAIYF